MSINNSIDRKHMPSSYEQQKSVSNLNYNIPEAETTNKLEKLIREMLIKNEMGINTKDLG